jgi:hypothetical protein
MTMEELPDLERSVTVLIGVGTYKHRPQPRALRPDPAPPGAALLDFSDRLDDESYGGNRIVGLSGITMTGRDRALVVDDKKARLGAADRLDVRRRHDAAQGRGRGRVRGRGVRR